MVWPPRYGTAASGGTGAREIVRGPTDEVTSTRLADGALRLSEPTVNMFPSWAPSALYIWQPETEPTADQIKSSAVWAFLQRPPEIIGLGGDAIRLVQAQWPVEGTLYELLGLFIYSRPVGSVSWRANPVHYPFTAQAAARNGTTAYRVNVSTLPSDEYQARTRYLWTRPGVEFAGTILGGGGVPGLTLIRVSELQQSGTGCSLQVQRAGQINYFINEIFLDLRELGAGNVGASLGSTSQSPFFFQNQINTAISDNSNGGVAGHLGMTRFTYILFTA